MTEEAARRVLIDRAGIEFDPGVVNVFLSLDQFDEYAISERLVGI